MHIIFIITIHTGGNTTTVVADEEFKLSIYKLCVVYDYESVFLVQVF